MLVDLSHPISDGMVTYPGIPGPRLGVHLSFDDSAARYAPGTEFFMGSIDLVGNTGTYLDSPRHRYRDGVDLGGLPLDRMADLDGVVISAAGIAAIGPDAFAGRPLAGRAVLVHTGHAEHWGSPEYLVDHPHLTAEAAQMLVEAGAALVGIDSLNIDPTDTGERPVHSTLLAAGIPVVEHLTNLDGLPDTGFRFTAAPPAIIGLGTFPVRAFARVET